MAKLKVANGTSKYRNSNARERLYFYIINPSKTPSGYIGCFAVDPRDPVSAMDETSRYFGKDYGVQLRHYILLFADSERVSAAKANEIAIRICRHIAQEYQTVYAVHETGHIHIHIMTNSVNYRTGQKCPGHKSDFYALKNTMKQILLDYNLYLEYVPNKGSGNDSA